MSVEHLLQLGVLSPQQRHFALQLAQSLLLLQLLVQLCPVVYCSVDGVVSCVAAGREVLLLAVGGEL